MDAGRDHFAFGHPGFVFGNRPPFRPWSIDELTRRPEDHRPVLIGGRL